MSRSRNVGAGVPQSRPPNCSERPAQQPDVVIHGWSVFAHPLFLDQYEKLLQQVAELRAKDPMGHEKKNAAKRLAAIVSLAFDVIPQDPARPEYRQGNTLGDEHKHWFRAKFFQQFRLFFRFHAPSKVIVLGWVNDVDSKRIRARFRRVPGVQEDAGQRSQRGIGKTAAEGDHGRGV